jgi:GDPmannose 4,6-dehydratase
MGERRAFITGIGGQDGSLLAEHLLELGYEVVGVAPRPLSSYPNLAGTADLLDVRQVDLTDPVAILRILRDFRPHEVYNLASVSFVPASWEQPVQTAHQSAVGVTALLEAVRTVDPSIRFFQASSSEIFGDPVEMPQREDTPLRPYTPYGVAKSYGHFMTASYRRRYQLHASTGIFYNHESPRRPLEFLPRKVANAAASIKLGLTGELWLGDLSARRDWGYAPDYVRAAWLALQQEESNDYVIATGESHTVQDFVKVAFEHVDLDWNDHVFVDQSLVRGRSELYDLVGDSTRARTLLGWEPTVTFEQLVTLLVDAELERLEAGASEEALRASSR